MHAGKHSGETDVFGTVMRISLCAISEAATDGDDRHVQFMVADVIADLLETAGHGEIDDRVSEDLVSR